MKPRKQITPEEARLRMADLCARSEQCSSDIASRLARLGLSRAAAEEIIAFLVKEKFIDDSRFAHAFARDKVRFSGWGQRKISAALAMKHIPGNIISGALADVDPSDYTEALEKAVESKSRLLDLSAIADRRKLARHLLSRGFPPDVAFDAVRRETKRRSSSD